MKVSDFIKLVASTDLLQTAYTDVGMVVDDGTGTITAAQTANVNSILGFIQFGLVDLHKELPLKISIFEDSYKAPSSYDDPIVLPESCLNIQKITNNTNFDELPLDNVDYEVKFKNNQYKGIFFKTLSINKYMVNGYFDGTSYDVLFHYFDSPINVTVKDLIPLPPSCFEALVNYVGYRAYSSIKSVTAVGDTGTLYAQKYKDSLTRLKDKTDIYLYDFDHERLANKGFV
jgi:hypothetical protein